MLLLLYKKKLITLGVLLKMVVFYFSSSSSSESTSGLSASLADSMSESFSSRFRLTPALIPDPTISPFANVRHVSRLPLVSNRAIGSKMTHSSSTWFFNNVFSTNSSRSYIRTKPSDEIVVAYVLDCGLSYGGIRIAIKSTALTLGEKYSNSSCAKRKQYSYRFWWPIN